MSDERFKKIIGFLIAGVTLIATIIAFLESDAGNRDDRANRDAQTYAMSALGQKVSGNAQTNYDYYTAYQTWYELDVLANASEAREDEDAAERYRTVRDHMTTLSPLFAPEYFDHETGTVDIARYEADTYLVEITRLSENFSSAAAVKDIWDTKANTYTVHLTLLAISLFLLGLSTTVSTQMTRTVFVITGVMIALIGAGWAALVYAEPVTDLRSQNVIEPYAQGVGLAHQERYEEALAAFDQALKTVPNYINALTARGSTYVTLEDYEKAAADYEAARAQGDQTVWVAGDLAYCYFKLGRFEDAVTLSHEILAIAPDELWIRFDLGLTLLAAGQGEAAKAEYQTGMTKAAEIVATARAAGQQPPSDVWWSLDEAAYELDALIAETGENSEATPLFTQLKSLSTALELTSSPPQGELTATISPFEFAEPIYDDNGETVDHNVTDEFEAGTDEVSILFDYSGMRPGQMVMFKIYIDGEEDPSWRAIYEWDGEESGEYEYSLSLTYSDVFILDPGEYQIEFYVDSHLAQRGSFVVAEE